LEPTHVGADIIAGSLIKVRQGSSILRRIERGFKCEDVRIL
jgi:cystathionine beta-lyase family protein involved in aluminum resistance